MRVRDTARAAGPGPRRGFASGWLVFVGLVLVFAFVLAVQVAVLRHRQLELQIGSDAATLAGANALVDDELLAADYPDDPDDPDDPKLLAAEQIQQKVLDRARAAARFTADLNRIWGCPMRLDANKENCVHGELVLGRLNDFADRHFVAQVAPDNNLAGDADHISRGIDLYHPHWNAVHVATQQQGVGATATAFVDRDVIGFKIQGTTTVPGGTEPAISVMPLAILTSPCPPEQNNLECWLNAAKESWEYQIMARQGNDNWRINPLSGMPEQVGGSVPPDNIKEIEVTYSLGGGGNGEIVAVGVSSVAQAIGQPQAQPPVPGQIQTGMTRQHLQSRGGRLALDDGLNDGSPMNPQPTNRLVLPRLTLADGDQVKDLEAALLAIKGQQRVWPLFSEVLDNTPTQGQKSVLILGFVAARVMSAQVNNDSGGSAESVTVVLQPTMFITCTAISESDVRDTAPAPNRRDWGPRSIFNPYICRVRLVE